MKDKYLLIAFLAFLLGVPSLFLSAAQFRVMMDVVASLGAYLGLCLCGYLAARTEIPMTKIGFVLVPTAFFAMVHPYWTFDQGIKDLAIWFGWVFLIGAVVSYFQSPEPFTMDLPTQLRRGIATIAALTGTTLGFQIAYYSGDSAFGVTVGLNAVFTVAALYAGPREPGDLEWLDYFGEPDQPDSKTA